MTLFKHQQELVSRNHDKWLCMWETGTGKTKAAVEWGKTNNEETLVICPKMLRESWRRNLDGLKATIISKEMFRRDWDKLPKYNQIIYDEIHHALGHTSQIHKTFVKYLKKWNVRRVLGLTATPYSNPMNVFSAAKIMGQPMDWLKFQHLFYFHVRMGMRMIPMEKPHMEKELQDILLRFGNTVTLDSCIDFPEQTFQVEWFEMTEEQKKLIKENYDPLPIVRFTREHQICGGTLKGDAGYTEDISFDCPKMERLEELIRENQRMVVVCRYVAELHVLAEKFKSIRPVYTLSGETPDRDLMIEELKKRESYCLFVQSGVGEGWELGQNSPQLMVFYSMDFRYVNFTQMCGRIRRINYPKKCVYLSLVVADSVDEAVHDAISHKKSFYVELYEERNSVD